MKFLLSIFLGLLFGIGLIYGLVKGAERPGSASSQARPALRILALGDSYTIGHGVPEADRWPVQLATLLRAQGQAVAEPVIVAHTGWTTADLLAAIVQRSDLTGPYELVGLLIGVNNLYQGRSASEYGAEFETLLKKAVSFAGGKPERVIVLSLPDWGASRAATQGERAPVAALTDQFNRINADISARYGTGYVAITDLSRQIGGHPEWLAPDGLHYAAPMHSQWAERVLAAWRSKARPTADRRE